MEITNVDMQIEWQPKMYFHSQLACINYMPNSERMFCTRDHKKILFVGLTVHNYITTISILLKMNILHGHGTCFYPKH